MRGPPDLNQILDEMYPDLTERRKRRNALKSMRYASYLKTEEWRRFRAGILARDNHACTKCGGGENLQVHHHHYQRVRCELPRDVITVCGWCHQQIEEWIEKNGRHLYLLMHDDKEFTGRNSWKLR